MDYQEYMLHYGVPGMKWGKRKSSSSTPQKEGKLKTRIKSELGSLKRERQWKDKLYDMDNMSNAELGKVAKRVQLENDLKRLSKSPISKTTDRKLYRERGNMSDKALMDRVTRLRAKENLHRTIMDASKEQREMGQRFVRTAGTVGFKYATTGTVSTKDIGLAVLKSHKPNKEMKNKIIDDMLNKTNKTVIKK